VESQAGPINRCPVFVAGGNAEDVARRNDPDRTKVVAGFALS
jgi:hypothetical protein